MARRLRCTLLVGVSSTRPSSTTYALQTHSRALTHAHILSQIAAVGITNQRETTLVWDCRTGKPLHNAIVWLDTRTAALCDRLTEQLGSQVRRSSRHSSRAPAAPCAVIMRQYERSVRPTRTSPCSCTIIHGCHASVAELVEQHVKLKLPPSQFCRTDQSGLAGGLHLTNCSDADQRI